MIDMTVNVPSFEQFLEEVEKTSQTKELSHKGHATKNGDQSADKVDAVHSGEGSDSSDKVEKSYNSAPGDDSGCDLPKPPSA